MKIKLLIGLVVLSILISGCVSSEQSIESMCKSEVKEIIRISKIKGEMQGSIKILETKTFEDKEVAKRYVDEWITHPFDYVATNKANVVKEKIDGVLGVLTIVLVRIEEDTPSFVGSRGMIRGVFIEGYVCEDGKIK